MKLITSIMLLWFPQVVLIVTAMIVVADEGTDIAFLLLAMVSSLLGVVCYLLFKKEALIRTAVVFLNFALFFEASFLVAPIWCILYLLVPKLNETNSYVHQYHSLLYYLLLSISVIYLVLDRVLQWHQMSMKYLLTFLIAVGWWVVIYHPYLENPDYLKTTPEMADYIIVYDAITNLNKAGITNPSAAQIVSFGQSKLVGAMKGDVGSNVEGKLKRVLAILPYTRGVDYATLYWKPLHTDSLWISLLCTFFLIFSMVFKYVKDPPEGAYVEKIVWCLLVFCAFEALHMYAFTCTIQWETLLVEIQVGQYVSFLIMIILLLLFAIRLRFVHSIEGYYYERRLVSDASRITRWRDAFDNWVLRQFMNPGELDRRFLTRRRLPD